MSEVGFIVDAVIDGITLAETLDDFANKVCAAHSQQCSDVKQNVTRNFSSFEQTANKWIAQHWSNFMSEWQEQQAKLHELELWFDHHKGTFSQLAREFRQVSGETIA